MIGVDSSVSEGREGSSRSSMSMMMVVSEMTASISVTDMNIVARDE